LILINDQVKLLVEKYSLTRCARCNFCESVCPTYAATRRRVHGPRGRIWLIIYLSQGIDVNSDEYDGLLSCLNCRACNQVCPAGIEIAEAIHDAKVLLIRSALK
jgi:glycolate oxidase iron-sulfur subunit